MFMTPPAPEPSDRVRRRLKPETLSERLRRERLEKATPAERASYEAEQARRREDQRIERLKLEIAAHEAEADKFYEP